MLHPTFHTPARARARAAAAPVRVLARSARTAAGAWLSALLLPCVAFAGDEPLFRASPLLVERPARVGHAENDGAEETRERAAVRTTSGGPDKDWILEVNGGGLLLGDFDGSGAIDLLLVDGSTVERVRGGLPGEPPRTFFNDGRGAFREPLGDWAVAPGRWGMGGALGDVDGDGWLDALITEWGPDRLLLNADGRGWREATEGAGLDTQGWSTSAAFLDADRDGILDLFVVRYLVFDFESIPSRATRQCVWKGHPVMCGPEGLAPQADLLLRGRGDGTFEDVTAAWGIAAAEPGYGLGVLTADVDGDGWTDLYVANDSNANHLWRNLGALDGDAQHTRFEERGLALGVALDANGREQAGMGLAVGDLDGDGRPDFFVTNFSGEHNTLYRSGGRGAGRWSDRSHASRLAGPSLPRLGWGTAMADFNHDGWLDLAVINGHVYPQADQPGTDTAYAQGDQLFLGGVDLRFEVRALHDGPDFVGRASAFADLDGDGDLDGFALELDGPVWQLENVGARGDWVRIRLAARGANHQGLGARVELDLVEPGGQRRTVWGEVSTAGGFQAAVPAELHFGLGRARIAELRVRWPDGEVSSHGAVESGRLLLLVQAEPAWAEEDER